MYLLVNHQLLSPLTGLPIKSDEFTHNNMIPFFGSRVRQNVDINKSNATSLIILDKKTLLLIKESNNHYLNRYR